MFYLKIKNIAGPGLQYIKIATIALHDTENYLGYTVKAVYNEPLVLEDLVRYRA